MCDFCFAHGDGKKWYLNARNYSIDNLKDPDRIRFADRFYLKIEKETGKYFPLADRLIHKPIIGRLIRRFINGWFDKWHAGQVVPLSDAKEVVYLAGRSGIARVSCVCRRMFRGMRHEPMCLAFGIDFPWSKPLDAYVDYTRAVERLNVEEATAFVEECDKKGYVHNLGTLKVPFIMGLCACEYPSCGYMSMRMQYGIKKVLRKAEYIARLQGDKCNACKLCISRCQFRAISYSPIFEQVSIDGNRCFGCGLCISICKKEALRLVPREEFLHLRYNF